MRHLLLLTLALLLVAACSTVTGPPSTAGSPAPDIGSAASTRPASPTPAEWSAEARTACASALVRVLVDGVNGARQADLAHLFREAGGEHPFQWVSMPLPSGHWVSYAAAGAVETLLQRSTAIERWELLSVTSGSGPSWHGGVDFALRVTRTAPDLPGGRLTATGKGAGSCTSGRIYVLSLGTD